MSQRAEADAGGGRVQCRIISLPRRTDRRALMTAEMARAGVEAEFLDAVDAAQGRAAMAARWAPTGPWGDLRLHDMACSLSHVEALARFLEGEARFCLVLEDDVFVSPELADWLDDMSWWPEGADVVKIEAWRGAGVQIVLGPPVSRRLDRCVQRLLSRHMGAAGYLVSREAARRIVTHAPRDLPIDHLLFNLSVSPLARSLTLYQVQPGLVRQGNEPPAHAAAEPRRARERRETGLRFALRELRRGVYEMKRAPRLIGAVLFGGARLAKPSWR